MSENWDVCSVNQKIVPVRKEGGFSVAIRWKKVRTFSAISLGSSVRPLYENSNEEFEDFDSFLF